MTIKIAVRVEPEQSRAARLVARLQLADLAAGREPVESRVAREVEALRERVLAVTEVVETKREEARNG